MSSAAKSVRETERKYETDDAAQRVDPRSVLGLDSGASSEEQLLDATYYDTADLRLLQSGITLRRREGGHDAGWHLKLPAGEDSREEIQLPLDGDRRRVPAEFEDLTRVSTRGAPLRPVAQLKTARRRWVLSDSAGQDLAELVEDEVHAHTMGESTSAVSWREVEVELGEQGGPELLDRIEARLLKAGARRSASKSKLRRVLADRLPSGSARSKAGRKRGPKPGSAAAAVLDHLRDQAERLAALDPQVRRDTPDALHQMRVTARRMRSVLQAYGRVLERSRTRALTDELKWLGGELALARDSEVLEQRLHSAIGKLPDELVLGEVSAGVTRTLARRRAQGQEQALAALNSDRYLELHNAIDALIADPPLTEYAKRPARRELPRSVAKAWKRTQKRKAAADRAAPGEAHDEGLHETRKANKRLRYAVELAQPHVGKPAKRLRRRVKKIHSVLGDHQDAVVARPAIRELAVGHHLDGGNGFTHGLLHGLEAERADRAEHKLPAAWKKLTRPKNTKWLKK